MILRNGLDKSMAGVVRRYRRHRKMLPPSSGGRPPAFFISGKSYIAFLVFIAAPLCTSMHTYIPNMSRALSRDKFGQTPCFSGPGLIIWPASLPRWTCLDRRASSQSNIRGFAGRAAAASDRRGSPPRALYVAGVASQFVATAGGVTFGLKSLPAGVPREQRPRE